MALRLRHVVILLYKRKYLLELLHSSSLCSRELPKGSYSKLFQSRVSTDNAVSRVSRNNVIEVVHRFSREADVLRLAEDHGMSYQMFHEAFSNFRRYCFEANPLPIEIEKIVADVISGNMESTPVDLFPQFLQHAQLVFPHLEYLQELRSISDLTQPHNWYPETRQNPRRLIYHAGPTNSGKTYRALQRFWGSSSGVYCAPLKLLATEVYLKAKRAGIPCDLLTGEDRQYSKTESGEPAKHLCCTIEMLNTNVRYEVAIIDEVQMLRNPARGWAWTRALLGVNADEVHFCGEESAVHLVRKLAYNCDETIEEHHYSRKCPLKVENSAIGSFANVQGGDCIVTFRKRDIFLASQQVQATGREVAVIYGGLPPGTKLAQAERFNDPNDPCKVLVATETGETKIELLSASQAKQIAGRAGRFGSQFEEGLVTTFSPSDLPVLKQLLQRDINPAHKAGLFPTMEQIELFAARLPNLSLSKLLDMFVSLCTTDESYYFLCDIGDLKFLSDVIADVDLPIKTKYQFCLSPVDQKDEFVVQLFQKLARRYATGQSITSAWLFSELKWPLRKPSSVEDLVHLEQVFDVMDLYLWLGYRFKEAFPDMETVRAVQLDVDSVITESVSNIPNLLKESRYKIVEQVPGTLVKPIESATPAPIVVLPQKPAKPDSAKKSFLKRFEKKTKN